MSSINWSRVILGGLVAGMLINVVEFFLNGVIANSRYILFSEATAGLRIPFVTAYYQLLICRVSDGECVSIRTFGAGAGDTENFHWITDYRKFCSSCMPGQPFN